MAILVDQDSRVIVQGATGRVGRTFAERMGRHYDTYVAGVTPGRGGQEIAGRPVYDTVAEAAYHCGANVSVITVPAPFVADAVYEAIDAGIRVVTIYTDLVPIHDTLAYATVARASGVAIIGPNAAGVVSPGKASASELNDAILDEGRIGVVSKSGTLSYEVIDVLRELGHGQSTVCCLGGDPLAGTHFDDVLREFERDENTDGVILLGEVGGRDEIEAAGVIEHMSKPVVAYVAGHSAPPEKQMGHAGAIAGGEAETSAAKSEVLRDAGAVVVDLVEEMPRAIEAAFR